MAGKGYLIDNELGIIVGAEGAGKTSTRIERAGLPMRSCERTICTTPHRVGIKTAQGARTDNGNVC